MAIYIATARTNYFRVKDEVAFLAWADKFHLRVASGEGGFALFPSDESDAPGFYLQPEDENTDWCPLDIADEIAKHLTADSIAIIVETGHENSRYVVGWAEAVNHEGEKVRICLDSITELAFQKFGIRPTEPSY